MYTVDARDQVVTLTEFPQASVDSPVILADDRRILLAYEDIDDEAIAIVEFASHRAMLFGAPNDEAFYGHPLAARGLRSGGASEVRHSSWIRGLERRNAVHPRHSASLFAGLRHFVLSFKDTTFECVAPGYALRSRAGTMEDALEWMRARRG